MPHRPSLATARQQYPHRYTMEHIPQWARKPAPNGRFYAPQYRTDAEWYANCRFPGEAGIPRNRDYCESGDQSWPLGQWLDMAPPPYPAAHLWAGYQTKE